MRAAMRATNGSVWSSMRAAIGGGMEQLLKVMWSNY